MKYMGSKQKMLMNGLGKTLLRESKNSKRFVDLFTGSGAVAWYIAENTNCKVIASDIQKYSTVLADAIIVRNEKIDHESIWKTWKENAEKYLKEKSEYGLIQKYYENNWKKKTKKNVKEMRNFCNECVGYPITQAYGGHYFSPLQAMQIDALRYSLPTGVKEKNVSLAALIHAASECAASPGHTAQPFQPTKTAKEYLFGAWKESIFDHASNALKKIGPRHAKTVGESLVCDAFELAVLLEEGDLVFIDPPYSGVHYSRFYHVLETIARGSCSVVEGVGRYPPSNERPKSDYSLRTKSKEALKNLLEALSKRRVKVVLTFPKEKTSNGLSGSIVRRLAEKYFLVKQKTVNGRFSTLGKAHVSAYEVILTMKPFIGN